MFIIDKFVHVSIIERAIIRVVDGHSRANVKRRSVVVHYFNILITFMP